MSRLSLIRFASRLVWLTALVLGGCAIGRPTTPPPATYDFGPLPVSLGGADRSNLGLEVRMPAWVDSTGIAYRLAYGEGGRRYEYGLSRWSAPPAQLLALNWRQQLGLSRGGEGSDRRCRIRVEVDEFIQVFDTPQSSRGLLQGRMTLVGKQGTVLGVQPLQQIRPAPAPDARGGTVALTEAASAAGQAMAAWLHSMEEGGRLRDCR